MVGAWAATETERALGITDPGPVVIDEVMGMCVTLIAAPLSWPAALAGFLLFRVFDIVKPPPARRLERLHGGWGIMADDLAAGSTPGRRCRRCSMAGPGMAGVTRLAADGGRRSPSAASCSTLGRTDTNSPHIAAALQRYGIAVQFTTVVGDEPRRARRCRCATRWRVPIS